MHSKTGVGWIDFFKAPTFNKAGTKFVYTGPQEQVGLNDAYQHLILVDIKTKNQKPLTSGEFYVYDVLYWDEKINEIFYCANAKGAPHIKHIFSVQADENVVGERRHNCWTCNITREDVLQTYFSATFSKDGSYAMVVNEGPSLPRADIVQINPKTSSLFILNRFNIFVIYF